MARIDEIEAEHKRYSTNMSCLTSEEVRYLLDYAREARKYIGELIDMSADEIADELAERMAR